MKPPKVDTTLLRRIATMAKLELSSEEEGDMAEELGGIVEYMAQISAVHIHHPMDTFHFGATRSPLREDRPGHTLGTDELGPKDRMIDDHFIVPQVVVEEES